MGPLSPAFEGKKALVTGGLGFIGSNLARALVASGAKVTVLDCRLADHGANDFNLEGISCARLELDVRDPAAGEACAASDFVFHVAGQTSHLDSMTAPQPDLSVNASGTLNLLEGLRLSKAAGGKPPVFLYVGTRAQYGRVPGGIAREDTPFNPVDAYGVSKAAGEAYVLLYGKAHGIPVASVRLTNTYGPRHQMKHAKFGILNWFVRNAMDGKDLPIYGDGSQMRDFLYIDDAVDAMLRIAAWAGSAAGDGAAPLFNLGTGTGVPFKAMADKVAGLCGCRVVLKPWPGDRKAIETGDFVYDISRIKAVVGWKPTTSLDAGLGLTVDYYRKNKEHYW